MTFLRICIIISIFFILYSYLIYPLLLFILRLFRKKIIRKGDITPKLSILICAYNEEKKIRQKIENTLSLDYPEAYCQIIVSSDCSTDKTDTIVREYSRVKLIRSPKRGGKENALKLAIAEADGEILVFTDVATVIDKGAINLLVKNFNDPSVGVVSSKDKFITESGEIAGEGAYIWYEMFLRRLETEVNGIVGVSGSFFAARKAICDNWADDLSSDFNTVLNGIKMGFRAVSDSSVIGYYPDLKNGQSEFPRKVRTVIAGITVFFRTIELLNVFKYGLYSWQILSHKLMRWLVPVFLIILFVISSIGAYQRDLFSISVLFLQILFYVDIVACQINKNLQKLTIFKISYYFFLVNLAIILAWLKYLSGTRIKMWEPSKR